MLYLLPRPPITFVLPQLPAETYTHFMTIGANEVTLGI